MFNIMTKSRDSLQRSTESFASRPGDRAETKNRRARAFRVIATVMAISGVVFGLLTVVLGIVVESQQIHGFHNAVVAALLLVLSAPAALAAARAPGSAAAPVVHLVVVSIAGLGTMLLGQKIDVFTLPFIAFVGVLVALRVPRLDALPNSRWSLPLAILVAGAAVPLLSYALGQAELQRIDGSSEHAEFNHWVEMSFVAVGVLLLGALTALRPAAFRLSAWSASITLAVLGAASLALPSYASAMGEPWAWSALLGGLVFIVVTEVERRRLQPQMEANEIGGSR